MENHALFLVGSSFEFFSPFFTLNLYLKSLMSLVLFFWSWSEQMNSIAVPMSFSEIFDDSALAPKLDSSLNLPMFSFNKQNAAFYHIQKEH